MARDKYRYHIRRRPRNRRNFIAIPFETSNVISSLATLNTQQIDLLNAAFNEDFFAISIEAYWVFIDHAPTAGPLYVGFAHGDYTDTEINEYLTAEILGPDDKIKNEKSRRQVRRAGVFATLATTSPEESLNDGKAIKTPLRFSVGNGHDISMWIRNGSPGTLTSGTVQCFGTLYGRWQR